jgi:hypothetical protein
MAKSAHSSKELIKVLAELKKHGYESERRKSGTIKIKTPDGPIFTHATTKAAQNVKGYFWRKYKIQL